MIRFESGASSRQVFTDDRHDSPGWRNLEVETDRFAAELQRSCLWGTEAGTAARLALRDDERNVEVPLVLQEPHRIGFVITSPALVKRPDVSV